MAEGPNTYMRMARRHGGQVAGKGEKNKGRIRGKKKWCFQIGSAYWKRRTTAVNYKTLGFKMH